jgi:hypothetical protein
VSKDMVSLTKVAGKRQLTGRRVIVTILAAGAFMALMIIAPSMRTQYAASASAARPAPTPPLDKEAAAALVDQLKETLSDSIEDEDAVSAIQTKWDARIVANKTRAQILTLLFADVKSVVQDKATQDAVWESWKEIGVEAATEPDETTPVPETPQPVTPTAPPAVVPRGATMAIAPGVLDDARKKSMSGMEMAFFNSSTQGVRFVKESGNYSGNWYAIYKDPVDKELDIKIAAIHLAVKTIVDKGLRLPYDLRFYCTPKYEAQDRAFPRGDKWVPTALVVFKWGLVGKSDMGSVSQMNFPGFNRLTITMIHEIGHIMHERSAGDVLFWGRGSGVVDGKPSTAAKVSVYAGGSKKEFVAEVFAGLILGKQWPADVLAEYDSHKGPSVP